MSRMPRPFWATLMEAAAVSVYSRLVLTPNGWEQIPQRLDPGGGR
jgi:hypothetical protein